MKNITESPSEYDNLESLAIEDCLRAMNQLDQTVALSVQSCIPQISPFIQALSQRMPQGGRLFYVGAGTSGRLAVLDAAECPPTFGVAADRVVGVIAGGETALRTAVEFAEDNQAQALTDMQAHQLSESDTVVGISASGGAAYVLAACDYAKSVGALTACVTCNPGTALAAAVAYPIECVVGPEFVTGSTRLRAGTATKLILNMISTTVMIQLGHVKGNQMIDMQLNNAKLQGRAVNMLMTNLAVDEARAQVLLKEYGSVRQVLDKLT